MKRKIMQVAESTQLISLPRKWCLEHKLKRGDEVEVTPKGNTLLVSVQGDFEHGKADVDVSDLDRSSLLLLIRGLYKKGYDEITLRFSKASLVHFRTKKEVNISKLIHDEVVLCPGMELIEQRSNYCVLKALSNADPKEFDNLLRRMFFLIADTCTDLVQACQTNDAVLLGSIEEKHDNITKFT
ncbi:MAG: hypothetical protein AABY01_01160, partial [Nanoarchaeota archaeon]